MRNAGIGTIEVKLSNLNLVVANIIAMTRLMQSFHHLSLFYLSQLFLKSQSEQEPVSTFCKKNFPS